MVMVMASSAATTSTSSSTLLLRLLCLCTVLPVTLQAARPTNITIGALFAFDSVIGRSARTAIQLAVDDVNRDPTVLSGTNLSVIFQDTKCSGFVATIQGTSLSLSVLHSICLNFVFCTRTSTACVAAMDDGPLT